MGVPKSEFDKLKLQIINKDLELVSLQKQLTSFSDELKSKLESLSTVQDTADKLTREKEQIQTYLHQKEDEVS